MTDPRRLCVAGDRLIFLQEGARPRRSARSAPDVHPPDSIEVVPMIEGIMFYLGAALVLISAWVMRWAMRRWQWMQASASWPSVEATLVRRRMRAPGPFSLWRRFGFHARLSARYEIEGAEYFSRRISFGFPSSSDMRSARTPLFAGEKIALYHDPESPHRAVILTGPLGEGLISSVFLAAAAGLAGGAALLAMGGLG